VTVTEYQKVPVQKTVTAYETAYSDEKRTVQKVVHTPVEKTVTVKETKMVPVQEQVQVTRHVRSTVSEQVPVTKCVDNGHYECREVACGTRARKVPVTTTDSCGRCVTTCQTVCEPVVRTQKVWVPNVTQVTSYVTRNRCVTQPVTETVNVTRYQAVTEDKQVKVTTHEAKTVSEEVTVRVARKVPVQKTVTAYECVPVSVTKEVSCDTASTSGCNTGRRRACR
jgi:hypothetical protein